MAARLDAEKFTGKNDFGLWRLKIRALLIQQGLSAALEEKAADSKAGEVPDEKAKIKLAEIHAKAHSVVILCLGDKVLREVSKETTAAGILEKLESLYMTKSLANRLCMKQRLYSYKFLEDRGIAEQLEEFNKAVDDLENIDVQIDDEDKAIMLLNALPRSYDHLRDAMVYGREKTITLTEVQAALRSRELQNGSAKSQEAVPESLLVKKFKKTKFNKKDEGKSPAPGQKETRSCHWCKKPGHLKKDCYAWKRKQSEAGKSHPSSDCIEDNTTPEILNVMESGLSGVWIMDSGCSFHMCPNKSWFHELKEAGGSVLLGNNYVCDVRGIGMVKLRMHDGSVKMLSDVRYIPEVKRNLVSLGLLEKKGFTFSSSEGRMEVRKGSQVVMVAERKNSLYYLMAETVTGDSNSVVTDDLRLWHERLGHPAEGSVKELVKLGLIPGDVSTKLDLCEECVLGKAKRTPFPAGVHHSVSPLEYAHSDLWGPAPVNTLGGGRYYMTIIDDYSRKVWVYILREKSEAFQKFKYWCKEVEAEKGTKLRCLRTDNGLEYLSREFDEYCKENGIKRHRTVPGTPQQNGVAERMNRTLMERVRCMLFGSGMGKKFWGEAVSTAAYLINKCPSTSLKGDTPDFRWYGNHTDYTNVRIFGCKCFAHTKQGKLDARALKCVMLGYQKGVKGYRLWCVEEGKQKVVISRDVTFVEHIMPYLEKSDGGREKEPTQVEVESSDKVMEPIEPFANTDSQSESVQVESGSDIEEDTTQGDVLSDYQLARDRTRRMNRRPPSRYAEADIISYALCTAEKLECSEPATYSQAISSSESKKWIKAMNDEIDSLIRNKTWILVERTEFMKLVSCKWLYKKKVESVGTENIRYKARLVARGFTQEDGVDYNEVFAPVVKHASIRILLSVVNQKNWELQQLDVKTAFLHGDLEESIYMHQPEGYVKKGDENKVCLLKKSLYGLKQSPRQWNKKFDAHMSGSGFTRSRYDDCVYIKKRSGVPVAYLLIYVDDILIAGPSKEEVQLVKDGLNKSFEMKDLGDAKRILGMDIFRNRKDRTLWLSQADYVDKVLKRFNLHNVKPTATPIAQHFKLCKAQASSNQQEAKELESIPYANIIGSLMYAMLCTRPDISHAVSVTSRYMSAFGKEHWNALKWTLRYLKGTGKVGILYKRWDESEGEAVQGFCDADYATNLDNRKSQTGYVFTMFGSAISWKSSLQSVVALSTTEAEYISLTSAVKESFWIRGMTAEFEVHQKAITVHCDSSSALCLARHQVFHERSKHIDVRLHFIRDEVEKGNAKVVKISTLHNPADMLTKALPKEKLEHCKELINVSVCD